MTFHARGSQAARWSSTWCATGGRNLDMRAATRAVLSRAVARVRHPMYLPLANGFAHCRAVTCVRHTPTVSPAAGKPDWQEGSYAPRAGYPRLGPSYAARRCRTRPTVAAALTGSPAAPAGRLYLCSYVAAAVGWKVVPKLFWMNAASRRRAIARVAFHPVGVLCTRRTGTHLRRPADGETSARRSMVAGEGDLACGRADRGVACLQHEDGPGGGHGEHGGADQRPGG